MSADPRHWAGAAGWGRLREVSWGEDISRCEKEEGVSSNELENVPGKQ